MSKSSKGHVTVDSNMDGNVFAVVGAVSRALKRAGYREYSEEVYKRMETSESYDAVLQMLMEYVDFE